MAVLFRTKISWKCVCDTNHRNCMFHLCTNCPGKSNLSKHLQTLFENNDFYLDDKITYKQWVSTDRTALVTYQSDVSEFVEALTDNCMNFAIIT